MSSEPSDARASTRAAASRPCHTGCTDSTCHGAPRDIVTTHLVDTTLFYSATSGGVRRYLLEKHSWMAARTSWRHTLLVPGPIDRVTRSGIIEFRSPRLRAGYRVPVHLAAYRHVLASLQPDLIEAADPYVVGWQAARVAEELGIPSVAFCHSDLIGLAGARLGRLAGRAASAYLRELYERFTCIMAPSQFVAERLRDAGIAPVTVQPLGVDAATFTPERRDRLLRSELALPPATRLLVFAGRLAPEKNLPELYELVERLGDPYHLLVIGGERRGRPARRVSMLKYEQEPAALAASMGGADLLVHAGRQETFGLVALEAMACGLPVVVYPGGALAELVDPIVGAVAARATPAAMAEAVSDLYARDPRAIGIAARLRVLQRHTWTATFSAQMRAYELLLGRHPTPITAALRRA